MPRGGATAYSNCAVCLSVCSLTGPDGSRLQETVWSQSQYLGESPPECWPSQLVVNAVETTPLMLFGNASNFPLLCFNFSLLCFKFSLLCQVVASCLLYDLKMFIKLKMLLICTCPEYCWCCLKVKFDDSSDEFIISITSLVCSRFMCF